ncbi:MAG: hypothetical protein IJ017_00310 [Oscillospiraceae bacterium]|nr:hypothetical protein [Oscillospiraceae bacterium]
MIFTEKYSVGLGDLDQKGKITNKAILKMFEDTAGFHSDSVDNGVAKIDENGTAWIIMSWKLKVTDRPEYGARLTVETWSRSMERAHAYRDFRLIDEKGNIRAVASSKWSVIDINSRRIARIDPSMNELYDSDPTAVFEEWKPDRAAVPESFESMLEFRVRRCDTDIIGHMHNLNYLDMALEMLPEEVFEKGECSDMTVTYKNEVKVGETVKSGYYREDEKHCTAIFGNRGIAAVIKMW